MGEKGEGTGGKGGGNWEWGTPLSTPSSKMAAHACLTLYLIETSFDAFANRADTGQSCLIRVYSI